ncbi:DNA starvation/stationary phase protection protein Dps [Microcoleus sp. LEGE 07076]|uniref:DNA starvation/stationary phase protection protein Dps n=1 Tax=Microcoleus sp. LEGE 07076 TaxID=915322 RepID=UPI00210561C0|nr:DNA starvation/stationary phase protection protein Dps [Microcoleus sp. LEGE 07076]
MTGNNHKQHLYPTRIDMSAATRTQVVGLLNATLATTLDLKTQVKQAHWNVKGMDFYQLHLLFDEMAGELEEYVDTVAERITALGGLAVGTARTAASDSIAARISFRHCRRQRIRDCFGRSLCSLRPTPASGDRSHSGIRRR